MIFIIIAYCVVALSILGFLFAVTAQKNKNIKKYKAGEKIDQYSIVKLKDGKVYNALEKKDHIWDSIRYVNSFGNTRYTVINESDIVLEELSLSMHSILQKRGFPVCPIGATMDAQNFHWEIHTDHNGKTHVKCTKKYPWTKWPDEAV